jgi:putative chitinase
MSPSLRILSATLILSLTHADYSLSAEAEAPQKIEVTEETLARFSPRARADLVFVILSQWSQATAAGINTPQRILHFISQIATETGGMHLISEDLNYSAERLTEVFPKRVTFEEAQKLAHNPVATANYVYNGRLGNLPPNDGWTYRGSGLLQLTGRSNYAARGDELGLPFEANPDMLRTPFVAFQSAVAYWKSRGINELADTDNIEQVRVAVNGGSIGLNQARIWFARAKRTLNTLVPREAGVSDDELTAVQRTLKGLGFLPQIPEGSRAGPSDLSEALRSFQRSRGLSETGTIDEDTLYELTNPDDFKANEQ